MSAHFSLTLIRWFSVHIWRPVLVAAGAFAAFAPLARSATLSAVPMQGGMVMPMILYHADHGELHVMLDPTVPQLTPLRVSNPGDGFAPSDPWFDDLDPSRRGLAFSRRYGFVMDAGTDPLPDTLSIWIRRLASSPGLGIHRYQTAPNTWEPIFGTAGSPEALKWNGMMFHPAFTAAPGSNTLSATFEAYLVDNATGEEVPDSTTGPFEFQWTVVPDGRPALTIASKVVVTWPASTTNGTLEWADSPTAAQWTADPSIPALLDGQLTVLLEPRAGARFYRLRTTP